MRVSVCYFLVAFGLLLACSGSERGDEADLPTGAATPIATATAPGTSPPASETPTAAPSSATPIEASASPTAASASPTATPPMTTATPPVDGATTTPTATPPVTPTPPSCSRTGFGATPGESSVLMLRYEGADYAYRLRLPSSRPADSSADLLLAFHGQRNTPDAASQQAIRDWTEVSETVGLVVVAPIGNEWRSQGVGLADALLDELQAGLCVEEIYVTGNSAGGFWTSMLACALGGRLTAVAPTSGTRFSGGCGGPVPLMAMHFTGDGSVPVSGAEDAIIEWAANNGCSAMTVDSEMAPAISRRAYSGCAALTEIIIVDGPGHGWADWADIEFPDDYTATIWEFFSRATAS